MQLVRHRRLVVWLAAFMAVPAVAVGTTAQVSASCMTGSFPVAQVTGVVTGTQIDPINGFAAAVQADDGTNRVVKFYGRDPSNTHAGAEIMGEDVYEGELPVVGGRYTFIGAEFEGTGGPIGLSACAPQSAVQPEPGGVPTSSAATTNDATTSGGPATSTAGPATSAAGTSTAGSTTARVLAVGIGILIGLGAVVLVLRRRPPPSATK